MALINPDCCASLEHLIKESDIASLFNSLDEVAKGIVSGIVRGAEGIAFNNNLDKEAIEVVRLTSTISATAVFHLFRIQKESDDLKSDS